MSLKKLKLIIISSITLVIGLTVFFSGRTLSFNLKDLLAKDHPIRASYEKFTSQFSEDHMFTLLVQKTSAFSHLEAYQLSQFINQKLHGILTIQSISDFSVSEHLISKKDQILLRPFTDRGVLTPKGQEALKDDFWKNVFLSEDKSSMVVYGKINPQLSSQQEKKTLDQLFKISKELDNKYSNLTTHLLGVPIVKHYFLKEMIKNQAFITPLILITLSLLILYIFKSISSLLSFYFILFGGYILTFLFILLLDKGFNPFNVFSLFFVMIIATSDFFHVMSQFRLQNEGSIYNRLNDALKNVFKPCAYTTLTTSIGFLSLIFNPVSVIRNFGLQCAFGSLACFGLTFYVWPAIMKAYSLPLKINVKSFFLAKWPLHFILKSPLKVIFLFFTLTLLCLSQIPGIQLEDNFYNKFISSHPLSRSIELHHEKFNHVGSLDLHYTFKPHTSMDEKEQLQAQFENELKLLPQVKKINSFTQLMAYIRRTVLGSDSIEESTSLSQNAEIFSIYRLLKLLNIFDPYFTKDLSQARSVLNTDSLSTRNILDLQNKIKSMSQKEEYKNTFSVELNGFSKLRSYIYNNILENLTQSFAMSFILIFLVFLVIFRSVFWAFIAMIPNIIPLIFLMGCFSYFKIPIESNLVLMLCVTIGLSVDDTIHFLYTLKKEYKGHNLLGSVQFALTHTSEALTGTTFVLICSFPILLFADLILFQQIGIFITLALLLALLADFLLLPSILIFINNFQSTRRIVKANQNCGP